MGEERGAYKDLVGKSEGKGGHLEYLRVDERIILKRIFKKRDEVKDWLDLVQDRGRWPILAIEVMNIWAL